MKNKEEIYLKIATTPEEKLSFHRFLFGIYCLELGWHSPENFPDGIFVDEYDAHGVIITIHRNNEIIAGLRLVKDSVLGFPHERQCEIQLPFIKGSIDPEIKRKLLRLDRRNIMEITRLIGKRSGNQVLAVDLAKSVYWYGICNQIHAYFMVVDMKLFLLCHKLSIPLIPIGIPTFCEGSWTIPSIMTLEDIQTSLENNSIEIWKYLKDPSNLLGEWNESNSSYVLAK